MLLSPVISRLFSPADFGIYAVYSALLGIIGVAATGKFELAIPLEGSRAGASAVTIVSFALLLSVCVGLLLIAGFFSSDVLLVLNIVELSDYALAIPVGVLALGSFQIATYVSIREQRFSGLALSRFANGSCLAAIHTILGFFSLGSIGLIIGQIASHLVSLLVISGPTLRLISDKRQTCARILAVGRRYSNFPRYSAPAGALNAATVRAPAALLTMLFGAAVGGAFLFCQTVLAAPTMVFGRAIGQVYLSSVAIRRRERKADISGFFIRTTFRLAIIAVVPAIFIAVFGPRVFVFVFGESWSLAGQMSRLLALAVFAEFIIVPIGQTLEMLERQSVQLLWDLMRFIGVIVTIFVSYSYGQTPISTVRWYVCFLVLSYIVFYTFVLRACLSHDRAAATK